MGTDKPTVSAVVVAAGGSTRLGAAKNKVLLKLGGKTVLEHSFHLFHSISTIREIVLVIAEADRPAYSGGLEERLRGLGLTRIVAGGRERFDSVIEGINACDPESDLVLIHDGARPFAPREGVEAAIEKAAQMGGAILGIPLLDTLKRVEGLEASGAKVIGAKVISETVPRDELYRAQTPQVFRMASYRQAMMEARKKGMNPTDDACIMEAAGHEVSIVEGAAVNIKITTREDLALARALVAGETPGETR